jgi:LPXTG-site transpeptidase (sortase) family protein
MAANKDSDEAQSQGTPYPPTNTGKPPLSADELAKLPPLEREVWLARQQVEEQRRKLRQNLQRDRVQNTPTVSPETVNDLLLDRVLAEKLKATEPELAEFGDDQTRRFKPAALQPAKQVRKAPKAPPKSRRTLDFAGWVLEGLVIIAVLVVVGNWAFQQAGINIDWLGFLGQNTARNFTTLSRAEGPLLRVDAAGEIFVPPTATQPPATPTPIVPPSPTTRPLLPVETPVGTFAAPIIIAPTPTPFIVQAVAPTGKAKFAPPTRLLIPKIGLDQSIEEVTVNLGTWQVADYAVGHHQGTANAGDSSNMVLVGHRDIRGSVFLKLNELQTGDEIKVFSSVGVYRYIVTETFEVSPDQISVLEPSPEPIATLITCTPIGLATKRLIVRAKLV